MIRPAALALALLVLASAAVAQDALPVEPPSAPPQPDLASETFVAFEGREVPPLVGKATARDYQYLGILDAGTHDEAILSVAAWVPSGAGDGRFGLMLVPDVAFAREALEREGDSPLALRLDAMTRAPASTVAESSPRLPLGFPRWRAYLFNRSSSTLKIHAFVRWLD